MTKDEKFLIELYKKASKKDRTADPFQIGHELGYKDHLISTILKGLMQANLVKRYSPNEVGLTDRGIQAVKELCS